MKQVKAPILEIHGTGVHNRGAELMAIAISEKIRSKYPEAKIAVASTFGSLGDIKRYGFLTTTVLESKKQKTIISYIMSILSGNTIGPKKIDIVLDASGFAFSDQWSDWAARKLTNKMNSESRLHQKLILLPQALGTYEKPAVNKWALKLFERASLVFARDNRSYELTKELIHNTDKLKQCPDFTINVKPIAKPDINLPENFVAIVPNVRMLDKIVDKNEYIDFLKKSIDLINLNNITPVFILHDGYEDIEVIKLLGSKYENVAIIQDQDPRVLKWILGQSKFVIGSRFHALVSSLSQGVPCIGAGWSHKYPELFKDFDNSEGLIDDLKDIDKLEFLIEKLSQNKYREDKSRDINSAANRIKTEVNQMWELVFKQIDNFY